MDQMHVGHGATWARNRPLGQETNRKGDKFMYRVVTESTTHVKWEISFIDELIFFAQCLYSFIWRFL